MLWLLGLVLLIWAITHFYLRGEDLSAYDQPRPASMSGDAPPSEGLLQAEKFFQDLFKSSGNSSQGPSLKMGKRTLAEAREMMDRFGDNVEFDGDIVPVEGAGFAAEWVIPKGADMNCRLLYIHGGAFIVGSPRSHRSLTTYYANMIGGPVLSLDYRMLPENRRQAGIDDCRSAYQWMLENSPEGKSEARTVFISGDSAGGNLTLSLTGWIKEAGVRAPNAAVALSPATDMTMGSPSLRSNIATDKMLGPALGKLGKTPNVILLWTSWLTGRLLAPSNPSVSPAKGNLAGLPPTLLQASEVEMLFDDSVRYVNKARASGSQVELQTWNHVMHVWQMFHESVPEGRQALEHIELFLKRHSDIGEREQAA
jgi:monoterpene epsilon-lactone hydrolase